MSMSSAILDDWLEADGLMLLESWARDGYTIEEIATRVGISKECLYRWMGKHSEIKQAINTGRELVDYKVENALLKSALGYKTKEVKVTTLMRGGRVIETTKERVEKEQAPNVTACQVWLYNRLPKKWKNMNRVGLVEEMDDDTSIHITVERASPDASNVAPNKRQAASDEEDEEWVEEVNSGITLRKAGPNERTRDGTKDNTPSVGVKESSGGKSKQKTAKETKRSKKDESVQAKVQDEDDLDYWPDDWEDEV